MLLYFSILPLFFATIWAAPPSAIKPNETSAWSFREKFCSEVNPTLNISEVCSTTSDPSLNVPASTLKFFPSNKCDHAVYLVHTFCDLIKFDKNLTQTIEVNLTTILSSNNETKLDPICQLMFRKGEELGFVDKSVVNDTSSPAMCVFECVNNANGTLSVKPICNFILWSWTFIKNHSTSNEAHNILQSKKVPSASNVEVEENVKTGRGQTVEKSDNSRSFVSQTQVGSPPPVENSNLPQASQVVDNTQVAQSTASTVRANIQLVEKDVANKKDAMNEKDVMIEKDADSDIRDGNAGKMVKAADQIPTPVNLPSNPVEKEDSIDHPIQQGPDGLSKSLTHAKAEEDDTFRKEEGNEDSHDNPDVDDQEGINVEPFLHEKLALDDRKESQGVAKNSKNEVGDNIDGEDPDEEKEPLPEGKKEPFAKSHDRITAVDEDNEAEDSHFFGLFFVATFGCIVFYLIYQNKRKIIAMALEGKKGRHSVRRRPTTASYQKLDNKLDEVMASSPPPSKTHVIY